MLQGWVWRCARTLFLESEMNGCNALEAPLVFQIHFHSFRFTWSSRNIQALTVLSRAAWRFLKNPLPAKINPVLGHPLDCFAKNFFRTYAAFFF